MQICILYLQSLRFKSLWKYCQFKSQWNFIVFSWNFSLQMISRVFVTINTDCFNDKLTNTIPVLSSNSRRQIASAIITPKFIDCLTSEDALLYHDKTLKKVEKKHINLSVQVSSLNNFCYEGDLFKLPQN